MGTTIKSNFNFDDRVKILPLEAEGRVTSIWLKEKGCIMIEVRYFINNKNNVRGL